MSKSDASAHPPASGGDEPFWAQDPYALFRTDRLASILPRPGAPLAEQLNAVMRFALYYGLLLLVFQRSASAAYLPLLVAGVTFLVWRADQQRDAALAERMQALALEPDRVTGELRVRPTRDNPFMNVLVSDYERFPTRPSAADITDPDVAARAERSFDHDLYRDQSDVWNRVTSSRNWYTVPSTRVPNDQRGFAEWCFKTGPTCKEGKGQSCWQRAFRHTLG